jgi:adenylate cyclase
VFAIQDEISLAIVDHLKVKLLGEEKAAIVMRHTKNLEAYNLYLKGNHHCHAATASGFEKAIECFDQALQKDTRYALPYIGLAEVYLVKHIFWKCATKRRLSQIGELRKQGVGNKQYPC